MKVLITGGAGFLGRWFLRHHVEAGDVVFAVDDMSNRGSQWPVDLLPDFRFAQADLGDWLDRHGTSYDRIYHFAAPVGGRVKIEGDPLFNADSLRLDSMMFRWAVGKTETLVYPSSSAVYGTSLQTGRGKALTEGYFSAQNPEWLAPDEMYGFTKLVGERLAFSASKYGLATLCIRPFSGYGEGQSLEYPIPSIAQRALNREDPLTVWGPGNQKRDFIHVSDIVGATLARLEQPLLGYESMNIGSGFPIGFNDIARTFANIVGYEPEIKNDATKPTGVMSRWSDTARMHRYYEPKVPLRDGLRRVLDSLATVAVR